MGTIAELLSSPSIEKLRQRMLDSPRRLHGPFQLELPPAVHRLGDAELTSQVVLNSLDTYEPLTICLLRSDVTADALYPLRLTQSADGSVTTHYPDGRTCRCPVVPDDQIHADQLTRHLRDLDPAARPYTAARHRLEHELWHHLVGLFVYGGEHCGSPIISREAHGVPQPTIDYRYDWQSGQLVRDPYWFTSPAHEEWLVAALLHHTHSDPSYDHGARHYLTVERGLDLDSPDGLLAIGRAILGPINTPNP